MSLFVRPLQPHPRAFDLESRPLAAQSLCSPAHRHHLTRNLRRNRLVWICADGRYDPHRRLRAIDCGDLYVVAGRILYRYDHDRVLFRDASVAIALRMFLDDAASACGCVGRLGRLGRLDHRGDLCDGDGGRNGGYDEILDLYGDVVHDCDFCRVSSATLSAICLPPTLSQTPRDPWLVKSTRHGNLGD